MQADRNLLNLIDNLNDIKKGASRIMQSSFFFKCSRQGVLTWDSML